MTRKRMKPYRAWARTCPDSGVPVPSEPLFCRSCGRLMVWLSRACVWTCPECIRERPESPSVKVEPPMSRDMTDIADPDSDGELGSCEDFPEGFAGDPIEYGDK